MPMNRPFLPALLLALLLTARPALAAPTGLDQAAAAAVAASPALVAVDRALEAARARARAAGAWPNPSLVSQVQLSTNAANNMVTVGVRQPLDFRGLAAQRRAAAEEDVERLRLTHARLTRQVAQEARQAYLALAYDRARVAQHEARIRYVEQELARGKKRIELGALAPHELIHVEFELAQARQDRQQAAHEAARAETRLNLLWGRATATPVELVPLAEPPRDAERPLQAWLTEAEGARLELQEAAIAARQEARAARLAESLRFGEGEIDLEGGTAANTEPLLYGSFALPVPLHNTRTDEAAAHQAEAARLEAERHVAWRAIAQEIADAHLATRQAAERLRTIDQGLLPLARHAVERAEARTKAGAASPEERLEARRELDEATAARNQALITYHQARLRLEAAVGR